MTRAIDRGHRIESAAASAARSAFVLRLCLLFAAMYFAQSMAEPTAGLMCQPVQRAVDQQGLGARQIGLFWLIVGIPWWLKPLFGMLTDFVPLARSHRRIYLAGSAVIMVGAYALLFAFGDSWLATGVWQPLTWLLLAVVLGVTFADVVVDALMIQEGQPRGITGQLQAVQWGASYAAALIAGSLGGYLSDRNWWTFGAAICAIVLLPALVLSLTAVREPPPRQTAETFRGAMRALGGAARSPLVLGVGLFLLLFNFNPFSTAVLQHYMTKELGLSEQFYGNTASVQAAASIVGCGLYAAVARRLSLSWLLHGSIALGVVSTLGYLWLAGETSALVISAAIGLTYMLATMVQLDLAARACPLSAAGTTFALLMAVSNVSTSLSTGLGGWLYELLEADGRGPHFAFDALVWLGSACTALCWLLVPWLRRVFTPAVEAAEIAG